MWYEGINTTDEKKKKRIQAIQITTDEVIQP